MAPTILTNSMTRRSFGKLVAMSATACQGFKGAGMDGDMGPRDLLLERSPSLAPSSAKERLEFHTQRGGKRMADALCRHART